MYVCCLVSVVWLALDSPDTLIESLKRRMRWERAQECQTMNKTIKRKNELKFAKTWTKLCSSDGKLTKKAKQLRMANSIESNRKHQIVDIHCETYPAMAHSTSSSRWQIAIYNVKLCWKIDWCLLICRFAISGFIINLKVHTTKKKRIIFFSFVDSNRNTKIETGTIWRNCNYIIQSFIWFGLIWFKVRTQNSWCLRQININSSWELNKLLYIAKTVTLKLR